MNTLYKTLLSLALLGGATEMLATSSVATTPVGCYPVSLIAGADTAMGIPLERAAAYVGRIASVDGAKLTFSAPGEWAPNAFAGAGSTGEYFYCQVVSGALRGAAFPILANDGTSITISPEDEDLAQLLTDAQNDAGDTIRIVPFWTPGSLFAHNPVPEGTAIVVPEETAAEAQVLEFRAGEGWVDGEGATAVAYPLRRGRGFFVRLPETETDVQVDILGYVPFVPERFVFEGSEMERGTDVFFALSHPESICLEEAGLEFDDRTMVFAYEAAARFGGNPTNVYTYYEGYGWFDQVFRPVDRNVILQPGRAYFVRVPRTEAHTQWVWQRTPLYLSSL